MLDSKKQSRTVATTLGESMYSDEGSLGGKRGQWNGLRNYLAAFAAVFYLVHGSVHVVFGSPQNLLWACLVANVLIVFGLLFRSSILNGCGTLMLCVGTPSWLVEVFATGDFIVTSPLVHFGSLACGLGGVALLGLPNSAWWKGLCVVSLLLAICVVVCSPDENINVVHRSWFDRTGTSAPWEHLPYLLVGWGVGLFLAQRMLLSVGRNKKRSLPREANVEIA